MKTLIHSILIATTLFGAVSIGNTQDNRATYQSVLNAVRMDNKYQNYAARDYTPMKKGEAGNCARFAATYQKRLADLGIESDLAQCVLEDGTGHAFTMTKDGWVLDNRFKYLIKWEEIGCKKF